MEEQKFNKPDYIENQTNNNCQQFFGNISGCVFNMPGGIVNMPEQKVADTLKDPTSLTLKGRLADRVKAVHAVPGWNRSDWGVVHRLLSMDNQFLLTQYGAGAKYINEVCGEEVTSAKAIMQSKAIMDIEGYHPEQWKFKMVTRESDSILKRYKQIAKIYLEA